MRTALLSMVLAVGMSASAAATTLVDVTLSITLDNFPSETGWTVFDASNAPVTGRAAGTYIGQSGVVNEDFQLDPGD